VARRNLRWLLGQGIRRFVDLTEEREITFWREVLLPYDRLLAEEARALGVGVVHRRFGIQDMGIPDEGRMAEILAYVDKSIREGQPVYVHCLGGKGRTGTVVACHLLDHAEEFLTGRDPEEALRRLTALRESQGVPEPEDSPQTTVQLEFVRAWAAKPRRAVRQVPP
jgi:hypothetical protein